jgi:16S rRNA (cytosine1402-N4)-methyltransferase
MMGTRDHIPVLFEAVLEGLQVRPGGCYIDATLGAAGHAKGLLDRSGPNGTLLAMDADPEAVAFAQERLRAYGDRANLQVANFRALYTVAVHQGFGLVDGVLMDLGLSSRQLSDAERGFAFSHDGPLDMRLDRTRGQTAADLVNCLPEDMLSKLLWDYGDERFARRIAAAIVNARPLSTTGQLADLVASTVGRRERIHPATRTFQALRIAVNEELDVLRQALPQALDLLRPGGRLCIIAFHSLEDRLVKRFFRAEAQECSCPPDAPICTCDHQPRLRIITRKPIRPDVEEVARNPRSRSARLRIAERWREG